MECNDGSRSLLLLLLLLYFDFLLRYIHGYRILGRAMEEMEEEEEEEDEDGEEGLG